MTLPPLQLAASHNLATTYFRLGATMEGAKIWRDEGFTVCTGDVPHPLCNFAAELELDPWSARKLRDVAESRTAFHVYVSPGDRPEHLSELLNRAGFVVRYQLEMMAAPPLDEEVDFTLTEAIEPDERAKVAHFMAESFFSRQSRNLRRAIADATAQGEGLRLLSLRRGGQIAAATMLCESPGVIGLFNLCVTPSFQRRGLAGDVLRQVRAMAAPTGRHIILQCDERLANFYAQRTFQPIGNVGVYSLAAV